MLFSQRRGLKPIKSIIQIDALDKDLRNALWTALTTWERRRTSTTGHPFQNVMMQVWLSYYKESLDTMPSDGSYVFQRLRTDFFDGEWNGCYDILEFIVGNSPDSNVKSQLIKDCNSALEKELSGYRFIGEVITPITSQAEISSIEQALADTDSLRPVNAHLVTALNYLSNRTSPDYRNSIKESISAVESLCNLINGGKDTLANALKKIETKVPIHSALKKGFSCIYGYTSDASGIRHGLLDEPDIDFDDAKFMLVSCSTFTNYLISKAGKAGIKLNSSDN